MATMALSVHHFPTLVTPNSAEITRQAKSNLAFALQILPKEGSDLILAGALVSITLNAILFRYLDRMQKWLNVHLRWGSTRPPAPLPEA